MEVFIIEPLLLIFVKNPEAGKVKTRLARAVGDDKALAVYQKLLKITKAVTDRLEVSRQVWYSRFVAKKDLWSDGPYVKKLQRGKKLGGRMKEAFRQSFNDGFGRVVIIGSDCAELNASVLRQAFQALVNHDVVIGPSQDGGYYLLGMTQFYPSLFEDKKWGTSTVCRQTVDQLEEMNASYHLLPMLNDIDTLEDLNHSQRLSLQ